MNPADEPDSAVFLPSPPFTICNITSGISVGAYQSYTWSFVRAQSHTPRDRPRKAADVRRKALDPERRSWFTPEFRGLYGYARGDNSYYCFWVYHVFYSCLM